MTEMTEMTETFAAAADYYRTRVLEDDSNSDRSSERQAVTGAEERLKQGQPLSAEQYHLATHVLARYLGFLARGGYSGQTPVARTQIAAVHAAQEDLSKLTNLEPLSTDILSAIDPDASYLREAKQIERERCERLGLSTDIEI